MKRIGIRFFPMRRENLRELTKNGTLASFLSGKIQFMTSSFPSLSLRIHDVSIITRKNFHSLVDHLGAGKEWDLTRKIGGLRILSPFSSPGASDNTGNYLGTIDALHKSMHSIKRSMSDYVILTGSNIICSIDYEGIEKSYGT